MLTYADVCWRMLTYADVCWRTKTERMQPHRGSCAAHFVFLLRIFFSSCAPHFFFLTAAPALRGCETATIYDDETTFPHPLAAHPRGLKNKVAKTPPHRPCRKRASPTHPAKIITLNTPNSRYKNKGERESIVTPSLLFSKSRVAVKLLVIHTKFLMLQNFMFLVSACYYICVRMCPHATIYVSSCYYICVRMLLYICPHATIHISLYYYLCVMLRLCVRMLLYMCPHATICPHTAICVSSC